MSRKRAVPVLVATGLVMAASAAGALAGNPVKGATYKGSWGSTLSGGTVAFKVSASGKKVSGVKLGTVPLHCQGAVPLASTGSAAVSKQGKFTATVTLYFPPTQPSRHVGTATLSGTFLSHGKESGKLATKYTANGFSKTCDETVSYSTKG